METTDSDLPQPSPGIGRFKRFLPLLGSVAMLAWVFQRISPQALLEAFGQFNWPLLIPLTLLLVAYTFCWDSFCLRWLFSREKKPMQYATVARARGLSYLFAIINFSLGQALLALVLARIQRTRFTTAVGLCVVMAYVDLLTLLSVGISGAAFSSDPRIRYVPLIAGLILAALLVVVALLKIYPGRVLTALRSTPLGDAAHLLDWPWRQLFQLACLRLIYFAGGIAYLWTALAISGFRVGPLVAVSVLPIIAMLEGLPLSVGGLGTRETALVLLLHPPQPELLVAFCLVWSGCFIGGRMLIGLACLWHPQSRQWLALPGRRITAAAAA